jgi:hypothetical protein
LLWATDYPKTNKRGKSEYHANYCVRWSTLHSQGFSLYYVHRLGVFLDRPTSRVSCGLPSPYAGEGALFHSGLAQVYPTAPGQLTYFPMRCHPSMLLHDKCWRLPICCVLSPTCKHMYIRMYVCCTDYFAHRDDMMMIKYSGHGASRMQREKREVIIHGGAGWANPRIEKSNLRMQIAFVSTHTRSLTHSLTHSLTRSLTRLLTHSLNHSLCSLAQVQEEKPWKLLKTFFIVPPSSPPNFSTALHAAAPNFGQCNEQDPISM